ncbi:uncharacterized protein B0H18DRAFT_199818 [Fomitopsis serialis]|uniref:uncharacterized protein n=1 Tax=Fomitopsis serialis TaxID=139415 RepID=UPI00200723CC|nr:uncharacterized protein B0H18DRAFT_199818 [Neoantrodia serialis]KAH9937500.1 hypothetical protein B0H18DRAFT_199818 [Neoantrodia serialis]
MPNVPQVRPRDGSSNGGGLSTSTVIIIAVVCGSVLILASVLFLWRCFVRLVHRKKSNPLPPVQLLAHQRGPHTTSLSERKTFYSSDADSTFGLTYKTGLAHTPSDGSLTPGGSVYPSRSNSANTEDGVSTETVSALGQPLSVDTAMLPNLDVAGATSRDNLTQSPSTALSDASSIHSHVTSSNGHLTARTPRPFPRSQSRPLSLASSTATMQTFQSTQSKRSVIRGAPHSRHSSIQIILPAPLAPESYPYEQLAMNAMGSRSSYFFNSGQDDASVRGSVASDQWVQGGARSMSLSGIPESPTGPAPGPSYVRGPRSLSQPSRPSSSHQSFRRSQSQSRMDSSPLRTQVTAYPYQIPPPPVPQIPAAFAAVPRPSPDAEDPPYRQGRPEPVRRGSSPSLSGRPTREASRGRSHADTGQTGPSEPRRQSSRSRSRRNTLRKPRKEVDVPP